MLKEDPSEPNVPVVDRDDSVDPLDPLDPLDLVEASEANVRTDAPFASLGARCDESGAEGGKEPADAPLLPLDNTGGTGGVGLPVPLLPLSLALPLTLGAPEDIST